MPMVAVASRSFSENPTLRMSCSLRYPARTFNDTDRVLAGDELVRSFAGIRMPSPGSTS